MDSKCGVYGLVFRVQVSGFRAKGEFWGFRVEVSGLMIQGRGFEVFRAHDSGSDLLSFWGFRIYRLGFRADDSGSRRLVGYQGDWGEQGAVRRAEHGLEVQVRGRDLPIQATISERREGRQPEFE